MFQRLLQLPLEGRESCFLFGPRGTGKTTWIKEHLGDSCYIDLLDQSVFFDLHADPHRLTYYFPKDQKSWIIIDEIQKIPALLNEVHRAIENDGRRFILTGSSARSLRKHGVNLLAGRALEYTMHPLTAIELGKTFDWKQALQFGQLPKVKALVNPKKYLKSYVNTYLREEVVQEGLTRNVQAFHRFLETASFSHGQMINMSSIAREIGVSSDTIASYFEILEDLLIARRIPVFDKRAKRELSRHVKFYYFDAGVYQTLRPRGPLDSQREINGAALEGLFLQELIAINAYLEKEYTFYFWRTRSQIEVDFVAYGPGGLLAFEIKSREFVDRKDLNGLKAFQKDYPMAQCYLLYLGEHRKQIDDIQLLPMQDALLSLDKILL